MEEKGICTTFAQKHRNNRIHKAEKSARQKRLQSPEYPEP